MAKKRRRVPNTGGHRSGATAPSTPANIAFTAAALGGAILLYVAFGMTESLSLPVREGTALLSTWTFGALGGQATLDGTIIGVGGARFVVAEDCTPVGVVLLSWGAVLASPVSWRMKLVGAAVAGVALTALNLTRVVSLLALSAWMPERLETVHLLVWQPIMLLAAIVTWLLWLQGARRVAGR